MSQRLHTSLYAVGDFISAVIAWIIFFYLRKVYLHEDVVLSTKFFLGIFLLPCCWLILYHLFGTYKNIYYKSRLAEFFLTFTCTLIGSLVLFFVFLLADSRFVEAHEYNFYYKELFTLFGLQFSITFLVRLIFLTRARNQLQQEKVWFNTLIIGSDNNAIKLYKSIMFNREKSGYKVIGFVHADINSINGLGKYIPNLGSFESLEKIIDDSKVQEVIIAIEKNERESLQKILQQLSEKEVNVKIIPDKVDILTTTSS